MLLILTSVAVLFVLMIAVWVFFRDPRSRLHQVFALGLLSLGAEAVLAYLAVNSAGEEEALWWMLLRHGAMACGLGAWILFSFTFGRPDRQAFAERWKWGLLAIAAAPLVVVDLLQGSFFGEGPLAHPERGLADPLGTRGILFLSPFFLMGAVLILMNLDGSSAIPWVTCAGGSSSSFWDWAASTLYGYTPAVKRSFSESSTPAWSIPI